MLLSKEATVTLNSRNITRLKNLGYILPTIINKNGKNVAKKGEKILVKIEDLSKGSNAIVNVKCDHCNKEYSMTYYCYCRFVDNNNKIYCSNCACTIRNSGENNIWYKKDKTIEERIKDRSSLEYTKWSKRVLARDGYVCQYWWNNKYGGQFEAHHIDGYNWCFDKRFDVTNGICLCKKCHSNFHSIYGKRNNTKKQLEEWFGNKKIILSEYNGKIPESKWIYCIEDNKIIKNINKEDICHSAIRRCCNGKTAYHKLKHYIYYDEYIKMSKEEVFNYILNRLEPNPKLVICINNGKIFSSISEAERKYNCNGIGNNCKGNTYYCGYDSITKEKLVWKYLKDYLIENNFTLDDYYRMWNLMTK